MAPAIEIEGLSVAFRRGRERVQALRDLSLRVEEGQVCGFLGLNGAGKTTAMHVLLGFLPADSGRARLFGTDVRASIARERIGYLPENPDTYRYLTGVELLAMTARLFRLPRRAAAARLEQVLAQTGIPDGVARRLISTYSRGQRQRLCLAQALVNDPDLLILDEPTSGLDPLGRREVRAIIDGRRREGKTVFFSSHELSEVERVCDHVAILAAGRLVVQGSVETLVPPGETMEQYFLRMVAS